jgi:hypothetical protein
VPQVPREANSVRFAEHVFDSVRQESTDTIIALSASTICCSRDLGDSWQVGPAFPKARFQNCFTTHRGIHLVQELGWNGPKDDGLPSASLAGIWRFSDDWQFLGHVKAGDVHWHATAAIDQAGDTIMFAEYTMNDDNQCVVGRPAAVWRSRDDGANWAKVFEVGFPGVRHFHTCSADPFRPKTWLLSSGDLPDRCRVWQSIDDGDSWQEITQNSPLEGLPVSLKASAQSRHRFTDLKFDSEWIWWATDDVLVDMRAVRSGAISLPDEAGARLVRSRRVLPLQPQVLARFGSPVRNLIDVGPGFMVLSEAKYPSMGFEPQVFFVAKDDPKQVFHFVDIANARGAGTGFSYSVASRKAKDGIFFCRKAAADFIDVRPYMLRWKLIFS